MNIQALATQSPRQGKTLRWEADRAFDRSDVPAPGRLVFAAILKRADVHTGALPVWRCPSYTELAAACRLGRSTVIRYVKQLVELGWLHKIVPTKYESLMKRHRNQYRIQLPEHLRPPAPEDVSAGRSLVSERDSSLDLKDLDQSQELKTDARTRAIVEERPPPVKPPRRFFPPKRHTKPGGLPILTAKGVSAFDQLTVTDHVQRRANGPIGNMNAYLTALDANGQLDPIIDGIQAPNRDRQHRADNIPAYIRDLNERQNARTSASDMARDAIRALFAIGKTASTS